MFMEVKRGISKSLKFMINEIITVKKYVTTMFSILLINLFYCNFSQTELHIK